MSLTKFQIDSVKPNSAQQKLADGDGLYLLVHQNGGKYWRFDYRFAGKRKTLALGKYPEISIKAVRDRLATARKSLNNGIDPGAVKKESKAAQLALLDTFKKVGNDWYERKLKEWEEATARKAKEGLALLNEQIGSVNIGELRTPQVVAALHKIELRSVHMAKKCRQPAHRPCDVCSLEPRPLKFDI